MRFGGFRNHLNDFKNASQVGVFKRLIDDLKGEYHEALRVCMMAEKIEDIHRAQGQARMLDNLISTLEGGAAPIRVDGISETLSSTVQVRDFASAPLDKQEN